MDLALLASVPVVLVVAVACSVLAVLILDVVKLARASRLTPVHAVTCGILAVTVLSLTLMFAAGVAGTPSAHAGFEVSESDPLRGVQLPTLPGE